MILREGTIQSLGRRDDLMPLINGRKPGSGPAPNDGDGAPLN
jgi:hypothetical protein